jgi:hypothetical protein
MKKAICQTCKLEFTFYPSATEGKFCSHKCYWKSKKGIYPEHTGIKRKPFYCIDCKVKFNHRARKTKRCQLCDKKWAIGEKGHNWKGGKPKCLDCGRKLSRREYKRCSGCNLVLMGNNIRKFAELGRKNRWKGHVKKEVKPRRGIPIVRYKYPYGVTSLEKKRFRNQRYKARKRNARGNHTFEEWLVLKVKYKNMCLCCKRFEPNIKLTEDHIVPISLNGTDNIENIQPLCQSCNTRKYTEIINYKNYWEGGVKEKIFLN